MPYSPPAGNAANFVDRSYQPLLPIAARFQGDAYTAPGASSIAFEFGGYIPPAGNAADFDLPPTGIVEGDGAVTVDIVAAGSGEFINTTSEGDGAATVDIEASGSGATGVSGTGAASLDVSSSGAGLVGVSGSASADIGLSASGSGVVERYELSGEVRLDGILVNRLVRAYRRDTGAFVGEAETVVGKFKIHTGFDQAEHFIVPIDTAIDATDWAPPCANRVVSVLAQDAA